MAEDAESYDDFVLPSNFNDLVAAARSNVDTLRHLHYPAKNDRKRKRGGKKPGPNASTLRLILYHLPSGASLPTKIRDKSDPNVILHRQMGYGYPQACFDEGRNKPTSVTVSVELSELQLQERIRELCPKLALKEFNLFKYDKSRKIVPLETFNPKIIKELKYQGIIVVQEVDLHGTHAQGAEVAGSEQATQRINSSGSSSIARNESVLIRQPGPEPIANQQEPPQHISQSNGPSIIRDERAVPRRQRDHIPSSNLPNMADNRTITISLLYKNSLTDISLPRAMASKDAYKEIQEKLDIEEEIFVTFQEYGAERSLPRLSSGSIYFWGLRPQTVVSVRLVGDNEDPQQEIRELLEGDNNATSLFSDEDPTAMKTLQDLNAIRVMKLTAFTEIKEVFINRGNIVRQAIDLYKDESIMFYRLSVAFIDEDGVDLDGLTRDFFCSFWKRFIETLMYGEKERYIKVKPEMDYSNTDLQSIGRLMVHGFVLTGYVPVMVNNGSLYYMLSGNNPTDSLMRDSFFNCLPAPDCDQLQNILSGEGNFPSGSGYDSLIALLSRFGSTSLPTEESIERIIKDLSRHVALQRPFYALHHIRLGVASCYGDFMKNMPEKVFNDVISSLQATTESVIGCIKANFSIENPVAMTHEETVIDHLHSYIRTLSEEKLSAFLRYATGSDVQPEVLSINFNGTASGRMVYPQASTCGSSLVLSRYYSTYESLAEPFDNVLSSRELWNSFSVL